VVSSALGAGATASGPLVLVIGDLSFYHDLNGLLAAKQHDIDVTIILLNNNGGGIFSFLPQSGHLAGSSFEKLFGTPHGLDFRGAVNMYGGHFRRVTNWAAFRDALSWIGTPGLHVVELPTDRSRNVALHRDVWTTVAAQLDRSPVGSPVPLGPGMAHQAVDHPQVVR
jgi:2-succinyl-5-enolpyruvyl-6-hydroxy-3-cyclohexene-1-carboxylate synthase